MSTKWEAQHRPVLVRVITAYDSGHCGIDVIDIATALRLTSQQVHESLGALNDGGLIAVHHRLGAARAAITEVSSVSQMARTMYCAAGRHAPDVTSPVNPSRRPPGDLFEEVVLRATTGP